MTAEQKTSATTTVTTTTTTTAGSGKYEITSTVFKDRSGGLSEWYEVGLLVIHEPTRRDLANMVRLTQPSIFQPVQRWKVENFFKWYNEFFFPAIHHHHDIEEKIFIPFIAKKAAIPAKIAADHKQLLILLDSIRNHRNAFLAAFQAPADAQAAQLRSAGDKLHGLCRELELLMLPHLEEEERIIPPIFHAHFTEEDDNRLVQTILKSLDYNTRKLMFPWILETLPKWATPEYVQKFRAAVPGPVRWLNDKFWTADYNTNIKEKLLSLQLDREPEPPKKKSCFCCC